MAIYYLDVKTIGGKSGRSSIGAAAYRTGEKLQNEHSGMTHDYTKRRSSVGVSAYHSGQEIDSHDFTRKGGIVHNEIILPPHAPISFYDRGTLWNAAEQSERNHNARTGREVVVALPNELTTEQQINVVRDYVQRNFVDKGMCADFSIHAGHIHDRKNEVYPFQDLTIRKNNPHAHIQLTVRPLNKDGSWGAKSKKEYILDNDGNRIKLASGSWKSRKVDSTDWDKSDTLMKWREDWGVTINKEFTRQGIAERIDHRTLKAQGINREPTKHMGHKAWNLEKKGVKTEIGNQNRGIMTRNRVLEQQEKQARQKLAEVQRQQRASQESAPQANPQAVAEYMNKLNDDYTAMKKHVSTIQNHANQHRRELVKMESDIRTLQRRTEDIGKLHDKRQQAYSIKQHNAQIRRIENEYRHAWDNYHKAFGINPNEGHHRLEQLRREYKKMYEESHTLQSKTDTDISQYTDTMRKYEMEYKKQRLIAETRPDKQEIFASLHRADMKLSRITNDDFREIAHDMSPSQVKMLQNMRSQERQRDFYDHVR